MSENARLPSFLRPYFWDQDFSNLAWETHGDFIIRRVLQAGSWEAVVWLRGQLGDTALRQWIEQHQGGGMEPRQIRFWELALGLPRAKTTLWVEKARNTPWEKRLLR